VNPRGGAAVVVAILVSTASASASTLRIPPHVGLVSTDGFSLSCETEADAEVRVEVAPLGLDGRPGAWRAAGTSSGQRHVVRIAGLRAGERVRWRLIAGGQQLAEGASQAAPPDEARTLDFLVYGDTRGGEQIERDLTLSALAGAPAVALHTGDLVATGDDEDGWRRFFEVEQALLAEVPLYLAIGNHELYRDPDATRVRRFLPLPIDADRTYYSFRVGPARFVALDSNRPDEAQTSWLASTLSEAAREPGRPHVFVFMHHPPFSTGGHCGSAMEQAAWVALFEQHRPTAVFAGHDHAYERLERNGVRYFVTGGGGAPVYPEREQCPAHDRAARRVYRSEHHLLRVRLRGEAVEVEVARPAGAPIEVLRWSRGDALQAAGPVLIDERRPTGLVRPLVATVAVATLLGLIGLRLRRRTAGRTTAPSDRADAATRRG
jgi:acid phosphatase type 7